MESTSTYGEETRDQRDRGDADQKRPHEQQKCVGDGLSWDGLPSREECLESVAQPARLGGSTIRQSRAIEVGFLEKDEDQDGGEGQWWHGPPKAPFPMDVGDDEAGNGGGRHGAEEEEDLPESEEATSLM